MAGSVSRPQRGFSAQAMARFASVSFTHQLQTCRAECPRATRRVLSLAKAESHVAMLASAWSRTPQEARVRIDNVEALLAMATTYESECVSSKQPASVGGLLRWLSAQAAGCEDARAAAADDAVAVLTHHGAKGLEWPVAILTGMGAGARTAVWDVRARTNAEKLDPQEPLRDRFIHCWPRTFGKRKAPQAALNAENSQIGLAMARAGLEENKRLLYVSMTRARDALVLVSAMKTRPDRTWVDEVGASELLFGESGVMVLDGRHVQRETRFWSAGECAAEPAAAAAADRSWFSPAAPLASRPLWHRPSTGEGAEATVFEVSEVGTVGTRVAISKSVDMALLGTVLHHCIARSGVAGSISVEDVERLLTRWDVAHAVDKGAVVAQVESFLAWIAKRWPDCPVHVEVPIEVDREDGTRLRGRIDFLVDTPAGWVLIDHKSNPRGAAHDEELVREHGPQLASYADALLRATGRPVTEQWLFLPVAARALRVRALPSLEVA
ncbi:DNA-dependent helicase II (plasmid) [Variovorax sp. RA8]|nr:DNA-dependent helicase II [Variovorax sp. RA8]